MMSKVKKPLKTGPGQSRTVATIPARNNFVMLVDLEKIKQGRYKSLPATLLTFAIQHSIIPMSHETCFEIRLDAKRAHRKNDLKPTVLYAGAFGPAYVAERMDQATPAASLTHPATVTSISYGNGVLVVVRDRTPVWNGVPHALRLGVVVVHSANTRVKVLPSTADHARGMVFRRSTIHPVDLDLGRQAGTPMITCARQEDGGCHSSCDDFSPEHMTPAMWKGLLAKWTVENYDGEGPITSWVRYV